MSISLYNFTILREMLEKKITTNRNIKFYKNGMENIYFHINNSSQEEKLLSGIFLIFFFCWNKKHKSI